MKSTAGLSNIFPPPSYLLYRLRLCRSSNSDRPNSFIRPGISKLNSRVLQSPSHVSSILCGLVLSDFGVGVVSEIADEEVNDRWRLLGPVSVHKATETRFLEVESIICGHIGRVSSQVSHSAASFEFWLYHSVVEGLLVCTAVQREVRAVNVESGAYACRHSSKWDTD
jgi:hypothetical protein